MTYMQYQPIVAYPPGDCVPFRGLLVRGPRDLTRSPS
jgi:hypothetical protein